VGAALLFIMMNIVTAGEIAKQCDTFFGTIDKDLNDMILNFCSTTSANTKKCACATQTYDPPTADGTNTWGWTSSSST
jgi:hypothetical protein